MTRILMRFVLPPIAALFAAVPVVAQQYPPEPGDGVADLAGIIDPADEERLRGQLSMLRAEPGVEVAVLTVQSIPGLGASYATPEAFATALYNQWQLGLGYPRDGVLVLVSVDDRFARIEVGDRVPIHLQTRMPGIMDGWMVPQFRRGEYSGGVVAGVREIETAFRAASAPAVAAPQPAYQAPADEWEPAPEREGGGVPAAAVLALAAALAGALYGAARLWRAKPRQTERPCPTCRRPMALLGETADDAFLDAGQRLEEQVNSVDYDVWHCAGCNVHHLLARVNSAGRKLKCVQCGYHTVGTSRSVLQWPTYTDEGRQRVLHKCGHCHWHSEEVVTVPRRVKYVPPNDPSFADPLHHSHTGRIWPGGSWGGWPGGGGGFGSGGGGAGGGGFGSGGGFSSGGGASGRW